MKKYAILLGVVLLGLASLPSYAQAPIPFISLPLVPDATPPGGGDFTLTINGTGFVPNSVVNWNGTALVTQFVSQSQLTATVPAADIATANTGWVTVVNPAPGGGRSNTAFFTVTFKTGNSVSFTPASSPATGNFPFAVAVGDFNGDGKLDLAVGYWGGNTVSIFLGDGAGNFTLTSSPTVGWIPGAVAVGDFNGDGKLDLAVADNAGGWGSGTVSILLGDGTGNFSLASSPLVGVAPGAVAVGDFNGDGKLDVAVVNTCGNVPGCVLNPPGTVSILLGDGTGNFTLASSPAVGVRPVSVAVGDFNGDGKLDLAVANEFDDTVSILLGDGTGNFTLASSPATGQWPLSVAVGDFNGDGKLDLAVANECGSPNCFGSTFGTVSILLGDGAGNFALASSPGTGGYNAASVALGDFNGDDKLDLAIANESSYTAAILLGDGTGRFSLVSSSATGAQPDSVAVGDFNGDGTLDLVVANAVSNTVSILLHVPPSPAVTLSPTSLAFGAQLIRTTSTPQTITLTNAGTGALDITSISASANFGETNNCPASLAPNAQCTINAIFRPQGISNLTGTLTITDNASNSPQTVSLSGVGTVVTLWPSGLDFGNQPVGTSSPPRTVTFTNYASANSDPTNHGVGMVPWLNHGAGAVTIFSSQLTGTNPLSFTVTNNTCGQRVPPGGSCSFDVSFAPKMGGPKAATIIINDDGGNSPQTVTLIGNGT